VTAATELRLRLRRAGFDPLPLNGKRPAMDKWQTKVGSNDDEIRLWSKVYPHHDNTGILTKFVPAIDLDILDPDAAEAAEALIRERYEESGYILPRFGRPPKRAIPFRTDEPFAKIAVTLVAPNGGEERVEFLADGQQVAAFGIHPDTKRPYAWHGGEPGQVAREELPYIRQAEARQLVEDIVELLVREHGYRRKVEARSAGTGNGKDHAETGERGRFDWGKFGDLLDHDNLTSVALALVAGGLGKEAGYNLLRSRVEAIDTTDKERKQRRLDELRGIVDSAAAKAGKAGEPPVPALPLQWLDMSGWDTAPVPERKWAIKDRVPLNQAGLFSGEGGTGKSIIELTKNVAHVAGKDWLGSLPDQGPAFYIGAEDDADEIHIRLDAIAKHYGVTFKDLIKGGLNVLCLLGQDATLCALGKGGRVETTALYKQLYEAAGDIKPKNISVDTLSRAFAGSEIDRVQVYAFAMHMQALAMVANGSVTVLSHPSLAGITADSGHMAA
jgi:hypothetical protein